MSQDAIESQGTKLEISDGSSPVTFVRVKGVSEMSGFDGTAAEIDTTDLDSTAKEKRMGLQDYGNISVTAQFLAADAGQMLMRAAKLSRDPQDFKITLSDNKIFAFKGFVSAAPFSVGVDAITNGGFTIIVDGDVTLS